jgi:hypothetical protein
MARSRKCIKLALDVASGKLLPKVVEQYYDRAQEIREALVAGGVTDNLDQRVVQRLQAEVTRKKFRAAEKKRGTAAGIIATKKRLNDVGVLESQNVKTSKAIQALFYGTFKYAENGRVSWARQLGSYRSKYIGGFKSQVNAERPQVWKLMKQKSFDNDVTRELMELREGGTPGSTGNEDARWFAEKLASWMEVARRDAVKWGASIDHLPGYTGPLFHDDIAMQRAGEDAWIAHIRQMVDIDRSFPDALNDGEVQTALRDMYRSIITGESKDTSRLQYLQFKTPDDAIRYRDLYGNGSTVMGGIAHLSKMAHVNAGLEWFGKDAKRTISRIVDAKREELQGELSGEPITQGRLGRFINPTKDTAIVKEVRKLGVDRFQADIDQVTGVASSAPSGQVGTAVLMNNIRSGIGTAKMGKALLSAFNDLTSAASASQRRGAGYWNGVFRHIEEMKNHMTDSEFRTWGYLVNEGADGLTGHISSAWLAQDGPVGAMHKWANDFYWWSGLTGWTDAGRGAAARTILAHLGRESDKDFKSLHPNHQYVLKANGITPQKWAIMRLGAQEGPNGKPYLVPDAMRDLTDEQVKPLNMKPDEARRKLEMDLRGYIADEMDFSIVAVGPRERRLMFGGQRPGTSAGEALRFLMQLKGYPIAYANRVLGRAFAVPPNMSLGQKIMFAAPHMGSLIAGMTVTGYVSIVAGEASLGIWPPRNPFDPQTFKDAFVKGGALGIYGDLLLGGINTYNHPAAVGQSGPTTSAIIDAYSILTKLRDGNPAGGEALSLAINNTPYMNLFYTRAALDALILNSLHESVSPGYLARQEAARRRNYDQDFVIPRTINEFAQ